MTTVISGSSPSITFSDATTQTTAFTSTPSVTSITTSADATINGLTVGKGAGSVATNTVVGASALQANTTGGQNVAVGYQAFYSNANSLGVSNVAVGWKAAYSYNGVGSNQAQVYIGASAGYYNVSGIDNTYVGGYAGYQATGSYNTALGSGALSVVTASSSGSENTAVGYQTLYSNTGSYNTAFGAKTLYASTANSNCGFGYHVMQGTTSGTYNTGMGGADSSGFAPLQNNITGSSNTAIGNGALAKNTSSNNTAVGYQALYSNTGSINNAFGQSALYSNVDGHGNTAIGNAALYTNISGNYNIAIGQQALATTTASNNVAIGFQALQIVDTGFNNTAIGLFAGNTITSGAYCTLIGCNAQVSGATDTSEIVIGNNTTGKGSSTGFINPASGGVYQGNNSATWSITSDQRLKKNIVDNTVGLSAINSIQVRNFEYRLPEEVTELDPKNAIEIKGVQLGAIAQELQAILPDCVKTESTGVMSVDTTSITWHLINAVKELSAKVTALENK